MKNVVSTIVFAIFIVGTVIGILPYLIFQIGDRAFDIGAFRFIGLVPLFAGTALWFYSVRGFVTSGKGTPAPVKPPKSLVTKGPYNYVRNPQYVGVVFFVVGESILFQSLLLLAYGMCLTILYHLFVVFYEEPANKKRFGQAYTDYLSKVPRWIPRIHQNGNH